MKKICKYCKYCKYIEWLDVVEDKIVTDLVCSNCESDYIGESVDENDWCSEWRYKC